MFRSLSVLSLLAAAPAIAEPPMPFDGIVRAPRLIAGDDGAALVGSVDGVTTVRIAVAQDGRPVDCIVTGGSGSEDLDRQACRTVMRRFRYEPAADGRGGTVAASATYRFRWRSGG